MAAVVTTQLLPREVVVGSSRRWSFGCCIGLRVFAVQGKNRPGRCRCRAGACGVRFLRRRRRRRVGSG